MPPLRVIGNVTTRPFASDDLHIVCAFSATLRILQAICIAPVWILLYINKITADFDYIPWWCSELGDDTQGINAESITTEAVEFFAILGTDIKTILATSVTAIAQSDDDWFTGNDTIVFNGTLDDDLETSESGYARLAAQGWIQAYLLLSLVLCIADFALLAAIWSASGVGTPTEYMGREKFLPPLLLTKFIGLNVLLGFTLWSGLSLVAAGRGDNYGCTSADYEPGTGFEATGYYALICVLLVTQAMEVFLLPAILVGKTSRWIRRQNPIRLQTVHESLSRGRSLDTCISGCCKCCGLFCCCKPLKGMSDTGELRDATEAVLDFFGNGFGITLSDLYICMLLVARVQRERRFLQIQQTLNTQSVSTNGSLSEATQQDADLEKTTSALLKMDHELPSLPAADSEFPDSPQSNEENSILFGEDAPMTFGGSDRRWNEEVSVSRETIRKRSSIRVLKRKHIISPAEGEDTVDSIHYRPVVRSLLLPRDEADIRFIQRAIRYAKHANAVYGDLLGVCKGYFKLGTNAFGASDAENYIDTVVDNILAMRIQLDSIGISKTVLAYSNFVNGIHKTPYSISIDEGCNEIVLAIRGTASLEDAIIDLQLVPSDLGKVGEQCGFDGHGEKCHKGVLTRCIWIRDDLERNGVLNDLLAGEEPRTPGYKLIVTGHSLGAGCAVVIACMLRKKFPNLECFAFCPPGGLLSKGLASYCAGFVTSFVNGADIIPRMSLTNCEILRDDALEILARVKVSKVQVLRTLRIPHPVNQTGQVNALLLHSSDQTPRSTQYYRDLTSFRRRIERKMDPMSQARLCLPGRVLHILKTKQGRKDKFPCSGQWAQASDFNEIIVSKKVLEDHSMDSVIPNLQMMLAHLQHPSSITMEPDAVLKHMSDLSLCEKNAGLPLKRDFICCSRPHGVGSLVAAISSTFALFLSLWSFNSCSFVIRNCTWSTPFALESEDSESSYGGFDAPTGIYSYKKLIYDGVGDPTNPDSFFGDTQCRPFPSWYETDPHLRMSRGVGALSIITGGFAMLLVCASTCVQVKHSYWRLQTALLAVTITLQIFVIFGLLESDLCNEYSFSEEGVTYLINSQCEVSIGAKLGISAAVLWLLACGATACYVKLRV